MANTGERRPRGFFTRYAALWPSACGLACAHMGLLVATQGSLRFTDQGVFSDGAATLSLIPCLIVAAILYRTKFIFTRPRRWRSLCASPSQRKPPFCW